MNTIIETIRNLINEAADIHARERSLTLKSVDVCGRLYFLRAHAIAGLTMDEFARKIGLTPDIYAKRAKVARLMKRFPRVQRMIESGELPVSSVVAIFPKLTEANQTTLLDAVSNKPKREVERIAARITHGGQWIETEAEIQLHLTLKESDMKKIDRAREVLAHGGKVPVTGEVLMKAIDELLERRDPLRKAQRAAVLPGATLANQETIVARRYKTPTTDLREGGDRVRPRAKRPAIPAAIKHRVMLRDEGRCTWINPDGSRCPERMMIEVDHVKPWRHGGVHSVENLVLLCRCHNQYRAELELGRPLRDCG